MAPHRRGGSPDRTVGSLALPSHAAPLQTLRPATSVQCAQSRSVDGKHGVQPATRRETSEPAADVYNLTRFARALICHVMASSEALPAGKRLALELFRRTGPAMTGLEGKVVLGTVVPSKPSDKFVEVDPGFKSPVTMLKAELQAAGCDTSIGARVPLLVEHLRTPLGEMSVSAERARDTEITEHVWREICHAHATGGLLRGRILNPVNAGFSVGLAGLVAFLPRFKAPHRLRIGQLDWFEVVALNQDTRNVVVGSPRYDKIDKAVQAERNALKATGAARQQDVAAPRVPAQQRLQRSSEHGMNWQRPPQSRTEKPAAPQPRPPVAAVTAVAWETQASPVMAAAVQPVDSTASPKKATRAKKSAEAAVAQEGSGGEAVSAATASGGVAEAPKPARKPRTKKAVSNAEDTGMTALPHSS